MNEVVKNDFPSDVLHDPVPGPTEGCVPTTVSRGTPSPDDGQCLTCYGDRKGTPRSPPFYKTAQTPLEYPFLTGWGLRIARGQLFVPRFIDE